MYDGTLVRLRAFEREDVEDNHRFMNDYGTLRGMLSGIPFPASHLAMVERETSSLSASCS